MVTQIPIVAMPRMSWPKILKDLDDSAGTKQAESDVHFILEATANTIDETKNTSVVTIGYSPEDHLIAFHTLGCPVRAVVCDPEYMQDAVVESIKHRCHARFYLYSDPGIQSLQNISIVTILGTTFSQLTSTEEKVRELLRISRAMLSQNASLVIELNTKPIMFETPRVLPAIDESERSVSQQLVRNPAHVKEILTCEAVSGDERIAVQNIRTFHHWDELKLRSIIQSCGFMSVRIVEHLGKIYIIASTNDSLPQRKVLWHKNN